MGMYAPVHAQEVSDDVRHIGEVEVHASGSRTSVASGSLSQTVTTAEAEQVGLQDISDVLRRMAGVTVTDYGGLGGLKTVSVRNMGAAHTAVSLDGIPVSNCQGGQIDLSQFSLWQTGSMTLSVGQGDDLLQTARTMGSAATLALTSALPEWREGRSWSLEARLKGGSWGEWAPAVRYGQKFSSRSSLTADAALVRSNGDYPYTVSYNTQQEFRRANDDILQGRGNVQFNHSLRGEGRISVTGHLSMQRQGLPGAVIRYRETKASERLWTRGGFLQMLYEQRYSPKWKLRATGRYTYDWQRYTDEGTQYRSGMAENLYTQQEGFLNATALWTPHRFWSIALAQDAARTTLTSNLVTCPNPTRWTLGTALTLRFENARWQATASGVFTQVTEQTERLTAHEPYRHVSPVAMVRYRLIAERSFFLRAMYKNSYRVPTFNDLYYQRVVAANLKPENAHQLGAGLSGAVDWRWGSLQGAVDGYWNSVTDKIVAIPTSYVWQMRNYGETSLAGIDVTLSADFQLPAGISARITGAYSWSSALDKTDEKSVTYDGQLPYTPRHSGSVGMLLKSPWVDLGWSMVAVGDRWVLPQNIDRNLVEGYTDHTISLSHEFRFRPCTLDVRATVTNVGNKQYDIIRYYPMPSRAYHLQISLKL